MSEDRKFRLALVLWALGSGYVWIAYPRLMSVLLLALLVFGMFMLAVAAMRRAGRPQRRETREQRARRIANDYDGAPHWWAR